MPATSEKQEKLMRAVAHNPEFAKQVGIPQSVGREFTETDSEIQIRNGKDELAETMNDFTPAKHPRNSGGVFKAPGSNEKFKWKEPAHPRNAKGVFTDSGEGEPVEMPVDPKAGPCGRAAGIMFLTNDGQTLLMRRGEGGDFPGAFGVPGGHVEPGENEEQCARREALEETGLDYTGPLEQIYDDGQFVTFLARVGEVFDVKLCDESTGYVWCRPQQAPEPLHPGLHVVFRVAGAGTELDIAQLMSEGILPSPQPYANMHLLAIRITGTGLAYRSSIGEHVWRDASLYLNDEFLQRCNGLTVIMDHPDGSILDSKEFKDRAIGSVMLPYIKGDEVWGIAKIYADAAMQEIMEGDISTSPSVVFDATAGNTTLTTESGEPLLIEGRAFLLDHIAIVTKERGSKGVWDKGGPAMGVELNNSEVSDMTDHTSAKADAAGDKLDAILNAISGLVVRVDAMEKNMPAEPLYTAADKKKRKDDDAKKDDDARKDDDEEEETEHVLPKKDAKKKRKDDDAKMDDDDAKMDDDAMMDSEGKIEGPAGEMKFDDDSRKDDDEDDMKAKKADEEASHYADAQAKADSVYAAFGKAASRPLQGESLLGYRKRLLKGLKGYSDSYKGIDLSEIKNAALLALAEKQIFSDALAAAKSPTAYGDQLVEHRTVDRAGRTISTFSGSMSAWLDDFKLTPMRAIEFRTSNVRN